MKILVTGSSGLIAAPLCYELMKNGNHVIGIDNYINSSSNNTQTLNSNFSENFTFYNLDLSSDCAKLNTVFKNHTPDAIIHLAALKSVQESMSQPKKYWENNINSTNNILNSMEEINCNKIIFSSSAAVYGNQKFQPVKENSRLKPVSIYGKTKVECEKLISDAVKKNNINAVSLRYFNPVGMHSSKLFKEVIGNEKGSIMQEIIKSALDKETILEIYGDTYPTNDGTCERDFIHIEDLIDAHIKSIDFIEHNVGHHVFNVGTGNAISIHKLIKAFIKYNRVPINYIFTNKKHGDIHTSFADISRIKKNLNWQSQKSLEDMVKDSWKQYL